MIELTGQFALLSAKYDFPEQREPNQKYMIASTPRSGSTLLAMKLWETGLLGAPLEYVNVQSWMVAMIARLQVGDLRTYCQKVLSLRTSPNGVFGIKVHPAQMDFLINTGTVHHFLPKQVIRVRRRDTVGQAISLVIASQTRQFSSLESARAEPVYRTAAITQALSTLRKGEAIWDEHLQRMAASVHTCWYEDLIDNFEPVLDQVCDFLLPGQPHKRQLNLPALERQASSRNAEWRDMYMQETR